MKIKDASLIVIHICVKYHYDSNKDKEAEKKIYLLIETLFYLNKQYSRCDI